MRDIAKPNSASDGDDSTRSLVGRRVVVCRGFLAGIYGTAVQQARDGRYYVQLAIRPTGVLLMADRDWLRKCGSRERRYGAEAGKPEARPAFSQPKEHTMELAKTGDRVQVQYTLTPSRAAKSTTRLVEFTVGSGEVIGGISLGVVGMAVGDQKRLVLQPQDAYGAVRKSLISEVPRKRFPQHLDLHAGKRLSAVNSAGSRRRIKIVRLKRTTVVVDANHPLAGQVLEVEIRLLALHQSRANQEKPPFDVGGEG